MIPGIIASQRGGIVPVAPVVPKSFVGATIPTPNTVSSVTMSVPTGVQEGDLLCVVIVRQVNTQTVSPPDGWTTHINFNSGGVPSRRMYVASKLAGASEGPAVFNFSGSGNTATVLLAYRGVATVTPGTPFFSEGAATATAPSIAMPADGLLVGSFFGNGAGTAMSISTAPPGMTLQAYPSVADGAHLPTYDQVAVAGAAGTRAISWSRSAAPTLAVLLGLT